VGAFRGGRVHVRRDGAEAGEVVEAGVESSERLLNWLAKPIGLSREFSANENCCRVARACALDRWSGSIECPHLPSQRIDGSVAAWNRHVPYSGGGQS
jgi:hypothetical protein